MQVVEVRRGVARVHRDAARTGSDSAGHVTRSRAQRALAAGIPRRARRRGDSRRASGARAIRRCCDVGPAAGAIASARDRSVRARRRAPAAPRSASALGWPSCTSGRASSSRSKSSGPHAYRCGARRGPHRALPRGPSSERLERRAGSYGRGSQPLRTRVVDPCQPPIQRPHAVAEQELPRRRNRAGTSRATRRRRGCVDRPPGAVRKPATPPDARRARLDALGDRREGSRSSAR